jgi:hypothetical protein
MIITKFSFSVVEGHFDEINERNVYHVLLTSHNVHEDQPHANGNGFKISNSTGHAVREEYSLEAATALGLSMVEEAQNEGVSMRAILAKIWQMKINEGAMQHASP